MAIAESLGSLGLGNRILKACAKHSFNELSRTYIFQNLLNELGIKNLKDEFESLYLQTTILFASKQKEQELIDLILLEGSKKAFKEEINQRKEDAFKRELNSRLHTNPRIKEIKHWNKIPDHLIEDFIKIYRSLIRDVASPVQSEILSNQKDLENDIGQGFKGIENGLSLMKEQFQMLLAKSDEESKLQKEYERQLNTINKTIERGYVKQALSQLLQLKEDIWSDANEKIKFKLLTNIGVCYHNQEETEIANDYFVKAYHINSESEIALSNIINSYISISKENVAREYLTTFQIKFPSSAHAHSIAIKLEADNKPIRVIEDKIPESLKNNEDILLSLGIVAKRQGEFDTSITYIKKALESKPENVFFEEQLLSSMVEKYSSNYLAVNLGIINEVVKDELNEALSLINKILGKLATSDYTKIKLQLHINKSFIFHLLGMYNEAIQEIDYALSIKIDDPVALKNKALYLGLNGKFNEAQTILERINEYSETPDVPCLLAETFRKNGEFKKAIKILEDYLVQDSLQEHKSQAREFLLELYIQVNNQEAIEGLIQEEFKSSSFSSFLCLARYYNFKREEEKVRELLLKAKEATLSNPSIREKFLLAEEFIRYGDYQDAIDLYSLIVNPELNNQFTIKLSNLYYSVGEKGKSLRILKNLREKHGVIKNITPLEISLYQEFRDYENAKAIAEDFLKKFPDDVSMKLRLSGINIRLENFQPVDEFLSQEIDIWDLKFEEFTSYVAQLMSRNKRQKAYQAVYEFRRKEKNDKAHFLYIQTLIQYPLSEKESKTPQKVAPDCAVILHDKLGNSITLIIEDRSLNDLQMGEINLSDEKYIKLRNKKVGDNIKLFNNNNKWNIQSISLKLIYAFHESQRLSNTIYSDNSPFKLVHSDDLADYLEELKEQNKTYNENYNLAKQLYRERKIPLGTISSKFQQNPILIWDEFRHTDKIGIQSSFGVTNEWETAIDLLNQNQKICADVTGLLTIFELGLGKLLINTFGKIHISTSTYDLIFDLKEEQKGYTQRSTSNEKSKLEQFFNFVKEVTQSHVPKASIKINANHKARLNELLGTSFVDTFLLAKQIDSLVLSDDLAYRGYLKNEQSVDGVWTQAVLRFLLNSEKISPNEYQEKVTQLTSLNYYHTAIDKFILLKAAVQAEYKYHPPFNHCLDFLKGNISDEDSSIIVGFGFLYHVWEDENIIEKDKRNLTFVTLTTLCTYRTILQVIWKLEFVVRSKRNSDPRSLNVWICGQIWQQIIYWKESFHLVCDINGFWKILNPNTKTKKQLII